MVSMVVQVVCLFRSNPFPRQAVSPDLGKQSTLPSAPGRVNCRQDPGPTAERSERADRCQDPFPLSHSTRGLKHINTYLRDSTYPTFIHVHAHSSIPHNTYTCMATHVLSHFVVHRGLVRSPTLYL